jgi:sec-independent protein translocase protein TatC
VAIIKDIDDREMPLLDHLIELRNRLVYSAVAILAGFLICYVFADDIYLFLVRPLAEIYEGLGYTDRRMIYTGLTEAFFTYVKVAFWAGTFITFPFVATQVWLFIAPGLYRNEKQAFLPFLAATPILFFVGGAFVYYLIFPMAWRFFLSFETAATPWQSADRARGPGRRVPRPRDEADLRLRPRLPAAGGADPAGPRRDRHRRPAGLRPALRDRRHLHRRAILTPPDVISQVGLALPMILLYEISILIVRHWERRRAAKEAAEEAAEAAEAGRGLRPSGE